MTIKEIKIIYREMEQAMPQIATNYKYRIDEGIAILKSMKERDATIAKEARRKALTDVLIGLQRRRDSLAHRSDAVNVDADAEIVRNLMEKSEYETKQESKAVQVIQLDEEVMI